MKKLVLLVAIATTLFSCGKEYEQIKLPNGAFVKALNNTDMHFYVGQRVCINRTSDSGWVICQDGEMQDTTTFHVIHAENRNPRIMSQHRTGLIARHL